MDSNLKILNILIDVLGPQAIIDICQKRVPISLSLPDPIPGFAKAPSYQDHELAPCGQPTGSHAPTIPGMTPLCCERAMLGSPILAGMTLNLSAPPAHLDLESSPEKTTDTTEAPPAPKKVVVKVKVKKVKDSSSSDVAKNLSPVLAAVKDSKPPLPPQPVLETAPVSQTAPLSTAPQPKKVTVKKVASSGPRCDGRVYGDKVEMTGTKAPTGGPLHAYKIAQCERSGKTRFAIAEDNSARTLNQDEEQTESEGVANLCSICVKRWEARKDHPENWHGFFDMDTWPDTSHFVGSSWYRGKMAKVTPSA